MLNFNRLALEDTTFTEVTALMSDDNKQDLMHFLKDQVKDHPKLKIQTISTHPMPIERRVKT